MIIDAGILITGGVGILTTIASGWTSWFFARKKYNTEVDSNEIENLKKSLEFYENIVNDNNKKLQFYIDMSEANRVEVYRLKGIVHRLLNNSCLDNGCLKRMYYTDKQIKDILGEVSPYDSKQKNHREYECQNPPPEDDFHYDNMDGDISDSNMNTNMNTNNRDRKQR